MHYSHFIKSPLSRLSFMSENIYFLFVSEPGAKPVKPVRPIPPPPPRKPHGSDNGVSVLCYLSRSFLPKKKTFLILKHCLTKAKVGGECKNNCYHGAINLV